MIDANAVPLEGKLVLVGAGKMGGAMLEGWLNRGVRPDQVVVLDPTPPAEVARLLAGRRIAQNPELHGVSGIEVVVLAIKPQMFDDVLPGLAQSLGDRRPLILSIAAGRTIAGIERRFGADAPVVRAMPNTPAAIGRGISAMVANRGVSAAQRTLARMLLGAVGEVVVLDDEGQLDAVTAVSGSGPAYIFYLTECLAEAGAAAGLPGELALRLARATVSGSGELMAVSGLAASTLRENVTSPKGTTYEALRVLMAADGLKPLMVRAVAAAARRSRELAS
jgi:pyrroline-5-carboxylate reductase